MRKHRWSDADVTAILNGDVRDRPEDLKILADAVGTIRRAYTSSDPRPSAGLAARLALGEDELAVRAGDLPTRTTATIPTPAAASTGPKRGKIKMFLSWLAGLGLAAKIGLGATAAAAAGVGAGAAGVLPAPAQQLFTEVVESVVPQQDFAEAPVDSDESEDELLEDENLEGEGLEDESAPSSHGDDVSDVARNTEPGEDHGQTVRDVASSNGQEASQKAAGNAPEERTEQQSGDAPGGAPDDVPAQGEQDLGEAPAPQGQRP